MPSLGAYRGDAADDDEPHDVAATLDDGTPGRKAVDKAGSGRRREPVFRPASGGVQLASDAG